MIMETVDAAMIERTNASQKPPVIVIHGLWMPESSSSSYKLHAVGFKGNIFYLTAMKMHQMKHPWRSFFFGSRTPCAIDRIVFTTDLCLNKQVAESRMCFIRSLCGHHHFSITCNI